MVSRYMGRKLQYFIIFPQMNIAKSICHATSVTARTSKAFSNQNSMQDCGCVQLYLDALQLFISCLNVSNDAEYVSFNSLLMKYS